MLRPGAMLRDYRIVSRLSSGGMATLYLAVRKGAAGFSRPVAIKVIHPHLAEDESFVRMFVDEATLSAKIVDPHVVHVEELGEHEGSFFLVMEYVHGCSLSQLVRALHGLDRRMGAELCVYVAIQIADGLHAAHETTNERGAVLGVVHRDVSPQNVLLSYRGHVKLIDFGIAKAQGQSRATTGGVLRGKLRYMAPEQAWGRAVDRRVDVYALGIVLWEMLTGHRLFDADNDLLLLEQVRRPRIEPPSAYADGISSALDEACLRALAPDPDERPQTALDLRRALIDAAPAVMKLHPEHLAGLLHAIMGEEIATANALLPDALPETAKLDTPEADDVLETMTVTARDVTTLPRREAVAAPHETVKLPLAPRARAGWRPASWLAAGGLLGGALVLGLMTGRQNASVTASHGLGMLSSVGPTMLRTIPPEAAAPTTEPRDAPPTPAARHKSSRPVAAPAKKPATRPTAEPAAAAASGKPPDVKIVQGVPIVPNL